MPMAGSTASPPADEMLTIEPPRSRMDASHTSRDQLSGPFQLTWTVLSNWLSEMPSVGP